MSNNQGDVGVVGGLVAVFGGLGGLTVFGFTLVKFHNENHVHYHAAQPAEVRKAEPTSVPSPPKPQPQPSSVRQAPMAPTGLAGGAGLKESPTVAERKAPPTGHEISRPVPPAAEPVASPPVVPSRNQTVNKIETEPAPQPSVAAAAPAAAPVAPPITVEIAQPPHARYVERIEYLVKLVPHSVVPPVFKPRQTTYPNHGHGYKEVRDRHPDGSVTWNYVCPDCGKVLVKSATRLPLATDRRSVKLARRD